MKFLLATAFLSHVWSISILPRVNTPSSAESSASESTLNQIIPVLAPQNLPQEQPPQANLNNQPPQFNINDLPLMPNFNSLETSNRLPFLRPRVEQQPPQIEIEVQDDDSTGRDHFSGIIPASPLLYFTPPAMRPGLPDLVHGSNPRLSSHASSASSHGSHH